MEEFVPSFIVNRIQNVINVQVYEMLAKGWATPKQIDLAIKSSLGIRLPIVGLAQSQDFTGLDLVLDVQKPYRMNKRYPQVQELVEKGHLGVKSGKGFYDYGDRTEEEILRERDMKYLKLLDYLEKIDAFKPI
jgi:3-hydroxyacyl-CoA dehydrogenase